MDSHSRQKQRKREPHQHKRNAIIVWFEVDEHSIAARAKERRRFGQGRQLGIRRRAWNKSAGEGTSGPRKMMTEALFDPPV
eukprot:757885-Hanusia_phi.AAC.3